MTNLLSTPFEARKAIRKHTGFCTINIAGPLEWAAKITMAEALAIIETAEINNMAIQITVSLDNDEELRIALWEK